MEEYTALKKPTEEDSLQTEQALVRSHESAAEGEFGESHNPPETLADHPPAPREELIAIAQQFATDQDVHEASLHPSIRAAVRSMGGTAESPHLQAIQTWQPWWNRSNIQTQTQDSQHMQAAADPDDKDAVDDMTRQLRRVLSEQVKLEQAANDPPLWDAGVLHVPALTELLPPSVQAHATVAYQLVAVLFAYSFAVRRVAGQVAGQEDLVACDLLQCAPSVHDSSLPPIASVRSAADMFLVEAVSGGGGAAASEAPSRRALALASCADGPSLLKSTSTAMRALAHVHSILTHVLSLPVDRRGRRRLQASQRKVMFLLAWTLEAHSQGESGQHRMQDLAAACDMVARMLHEEHLGDQGGSLQTSQ